MFSTPSAAAPDLQKGRGGERNHDDPRFAGSWRCFFLVPGGGGGGKATTKKK